NTPSTRCTPMLPLCTTLAAVAAGVDASPSIGIELGKILKKTKIRRLKMNDEQSKRRKGKGPALAAMLVVIAGLAIQAFQSGKLAFAGNVADAQVTYASPADAGAALAQATKNGDESALTKVLGGEAKALITSGDNESDKAAIQQFYAKYQQMNRWVDM